MKQHYCTYASSKSFDGDWAEYELAVIEGPFDFPISWRKGAGAKAGIS
jgi:hypothetical protein